MVALEDASFSNGNKVNSCPPIGERHQYSLQADVQSDEVKAGVSQLARCRKCSVDSPSSYDLSMVWLRRAKQNYNSGFPALHARDCISGKHALQLSGSYDPGADMIYEEMAQAFL